jgi:hypothetical protein
MAAAWLAGWRGRLDAGAGGGGWPFTWLSTMKSPSYICGSGSSSGHRCTDGWVRSAPAPSSCTPLACRCRGERGWDDCHRGERRAVARGAAVRCRPSTEHRMRITAPTERPAAPSQLLVLSCGVRVSHIFLSSGRARSARPPGRPSRIPLGGSLSPPTQVAQAEFCWLLAAGCWLPGRGALRSSDRLQIAQIYGTAEICKTGIQQPLTAAYDFRQIPADRARAQNEIEIGELFCGRLLNLRSHHELLQLLFSLNASL